MLINFERIFVVFFLFMHLSHCETQLSTCTVIFGQKTFFISEIMSDLVLGVQCRCGVLVERFVCSNVEGLVVESSDPSPISLDKELL